MEVVLTKSDHLPSLLNEDYLKVSRNTADSKTQFLGLLSVT